MREVIKKGDDIRSIRKPINKMAESFPEAFWVENGTSTCDSGSISISVDKDEKQWIKLTSKLAGTPIKYAWKMVNHDRTTDAWTDSLVTGDTVADWAEELNNADLAVGTDTRYLARLHPQSGRWIIESGGGGANTKTQSNPVIMLLGPWADYKDCPGVPAKPPTFTANGTDFCVPPYAWAAYDVCNYKYVKKFDMRDFGHWATELNGGSATAFRRLYNAYYGNSTESANLTANTTTNCKGVRFLGFSSQSSLVCTCPSWMTPVKCLMLKFKTIPRPCAAPSTCGYSCGSTFTAMDENNMWDTEYTVQLCSTISCFFMGTVGSTPWTVDLQFLPAYSADQCFWGPDTLDPCNPCEGFGKFTLGILSGIQASDCGGAGIITSTITDIEMKDLVTNCVAKKPTDIKMCNNCQNAGVPINFILPDSVELSCCTPKNLGTCP